MASESSKHLESILQDMKAEPCDLSLQTLKDITGNFADERELGRGGFGVVYKGVLDSGKVVAVKKLVSMPGVKDRQFENEVQHLMMLKHRNIVRFLGYCSETRQVCIKHKGRYCFVEMQERLLCLEYMSKGSLKGHISDEHSGLGWLKRFKIIKGICCGLHYLHEEGQTNTPVVHLDLKPANILLTKEMEPKITDFGLSRLFGEQQSRIYTARVEGTLGYMAREYLDKGIITKKSDIFSLGVIIMEIITGHRDYPESTGTSIQDFVDDVLKKWKNRLACLRYTSLEKKYQYHQIKVCIEIGLKCVQIDATQRPTTNEVIKILNKCGSMNSKVINEERSRVDQFAKQVYHQAHNSCYAEFFHPRCKVFKKFDSDARSNRPGLVNEDHDEEAVDGSINDAAIAESEASMYGLQVIGYGDLVKLRELGSGILGTVCYGKWRGTNVAIKCIKKSCFAGWSSKQEEFNKELWREAHTISKLRHPNIVDFYGVVPNGTGGILATVTEYMLNGSLRSVLLRKHGMLDCQKKLIIAMDAASGMEYLHSRRIVHLFLKCDNLLVNLRDPERPICKVGDFGFSRIKCNTLVSGGVRGHLPWMAPELLNGRSRQVSEKVDVFSFGIVLWEILTGEEPYATMHYGAIVGGIVNNTLRPPVPESCDPEWRKLMEQCWSADPVGRPSFVEVNDRLRAMLRVLQSTDNTTEPGSGLGFWPETRKKPEDAHVRPGLERPGLKPRAGLPSASKYLRAAS